MVDKQYVETDTHIYFWNSHFSNFYPCIKLVKINPNKPFINYRGENITLDNLPNRFWTSEQYFMYHKAMFFNDKESANEILKSNLPLVAKQIGRTVKFYNDADWDQVKYDIMKEACFAKYTQNLELSEAIMLTKNKILVEASPYDKIWGVGLAEDDPKVLDESNWKGQNLLGKVLMDVRRLIIDNYLENNTDFLLNN
jgi:ribA/ribD-fused uncharacterized protein